MKNALWKVTLPGLSKGFCVLERFADSGSWDTSRAYVKRALEKCIGLGRRYRSSDKPVREHKYEPLRLLGLL